MNKTTSSLIAFLFIFFGCNNEIEKELYVSEVPILIAPKQIETSLTKTTTENFSQDITNIGVLEVSNGRILTPNGISPSRINNDYLEFTSPPLVYPVDGSEVTLYGYYPRCCSSISDGNISFTLNGKDDLMWASAVDAGNKTTHSPVSMLFNHKLTKVSFNIVSNPNLTLPELPTDKISIHVEGPSSGTMDLQTGIITKIIDSKQTFSLPSEYTLTSLITENISIPGELLLLPTSDYTLWLSVGNNKYPINFDNDSATSKWEEGVSYLISIAIIALNPDTGGEQPKSKCSISNSSITGNITIQDK